MFITTYLIPDHGDFGHVSVSTTLGDAKASVKKHLKELADQIEWETDGEDVAVTWGPGWVGTANLGADIVFKIQKV